MAISKEEFVKRIGAECVGGKLIVGEMTERRIIGEMSPNFELTDEGQEMFAAADRDASAELISKAKAAAKKNVAVAETPAAPEGDAADKPAA
jgi:hypothetical protein